MGGEPLDHNSLEEVELSKGVHRLPEPGMAIDRELAGVGQVPEWPLLEEGVVALDVIEDLGGQDEEPAIDPVPVPMGLLEEGGHPVAFDVECPEPTRRLHRGDRGQPSLRPVELDQSVTSTSATPSP